MLRPPRSLGLGNKRRKLIEVIIKYPIRGKARLRPPKSLGLGNKKLST